MNSELNTTLGAALARVNTQAAAERPRVQAAPEAVGATKEPAAQTQTRPATVDRRSLDQALGELTKALGENRTHIHFNVDDESGQMIIKVIDVESDQTIRQIPPQEVLELARFFSELEQSQVNIQESPAAGGRLEGLLIRAKA